jgi:hypothetical protein
MICYLVREKLAPNADYIRPPPLGESRTGQSMPNHASGYCQLLACSSTKVNSICGFEVFQSQ